MAFLKYGISFFILLFLSACFSEKPAPKIITDIQKEEKVVPSEQEVKVKKYPLKIVTHKGARIRILNIKPKYHDNIELQPGKYLVEVSKTSYKKYKKWILLNKATELKVKLKPLSTIYDTHYFDYVTAIEWKSRGDYFSLVYDTKTKLIWALQSAYVDYVHAKRVNTLLKDILVAEGKPWPTLQKTAVDTLIYSGYFRHKGVNFLFKNRNSADLYKAEGNHALFKRVLTLEKLYNNSIEGSWRLPTQKEILRSNPFKKYQKYFQIDYKRYDEKHFNLPVLCTKPNNLGYISQWSIAYAMDSKTALYSGNALNTDDFFALKHAKNFALLIPVKKISNEYEKIIFDRAVDNDEKLAALTTLLIKNALKNSKKSSAKKIANKMASKAMHMLYGDPKISNNTLYSSSNNFYKRLRTQKRENFKSLFFRVEEGSLELKSIK